jgi:hypothetical protein
LEFWPEEYLANKQLFVYLAELPLCRAIIYPPRSAMVGYYQLLFFKRRKSLKNYIFLPAEKAAGAFLIRQSQFGQAI